MCHVTHAAGLCFEFIVRGQNSKQIDLLDFEPYTEEECLARAGIVQETVLVLAITLQCSQLSQLHFRTL